MAGDKNLLWNEEVTYAYGRCEDMTREEFIESVEIQHFELTGERIPDYSVTKEVMICTEKGIDAETVMPLSMADVVIENYWVCEIKVR